MSKGARQRRRTGSRSKGISALVALSLLLAGCAGVPRGTPGSTGAATLASAEPAIEAQAPAPGDHFSPSTARILFAEAYRDITDVYVDDVPLTDLVVAGLRQAASADPSLVIEQVAPGLIVARQDDRRLFIEPAPAPRDAQSWARLSERALTTLRRVSPILAARDADKLIETMLQGITAKLDRFSSYAGAMTATNNRARRDGFGGIGVRLDDGHPARIALVLPDTPAARAGLQVGDAVLAVDGTPMGAEDGQRLASQLRGAVESPVRLTIQRGDGAPREVSMTRAYLIEPTVTYRKIEPAIALLTISSFNAGTGASLGQHLRQARAEAPDGALNGVILDLRDNPGGILDQGLDVADRFLNGGRIMTMRGRVRGADQLYRATGADTSAGAPMIVLINGHTASAAEIVAAALQDLGRALVIGSRSYGKGTVQNIMQLPNNGELTLTWARFYAPSGYALSHLGVLPDLCTSPRADVDTARLFDAVARDQIDLARAHEQRRQLETMPESERNAIADRCPPSQARGEDDPDLQLAIRLLRDRGLYHRVMAQVMVATAAP